MIITCILFLSRQLVKRLKYQKLIVADWVYQKIFITKIMKDLAMDHKKQNPFSFSQQT